MKALRVIAWLAIASFVIACLGWLILAHANRKAAQDDEMLVRKKTILIAHALGGVDSNTYTNSLEAFQQSYKNGFRVFETDVMEAGDGSLVLFHTLGSMTSEFGLDKRIRDIGKNEFLRLKYFDKYSPLVPETLFSLLASHADAWMILDVKNSRDGEQYDDLTHDPVRFREVQLRLADEVRKYPPSIRSRLIPQIYAPSDLAVIKETKLYEKVIFTTYRSSLSLEEMLAFVESNPEVIGVAFEKNRFSAEAARRMREMGRLYLVFTMNDPAEMAALVKQGVDGFYTDHFLPGPEQIFLRDLLTESQLRMVAR
jgi:glycerophosphoryl diester phosphodiesterase